MTNKNQYYKLTILYEPYLVEALPNDCGCLQDWGAPQDANSFSGKFGKKVLETIDPQIEMKKNPGLKLKNTTAALPLFATDGTKIRRIKYNKEKNLLGAELIIPPNKVKDIVSYNQDSFGEDGGVTTWKGSLKITMMDGKREYEWGFYLEEMTGRMINKA
jgi:hypothetical protein